MSLAAAEAVIIISKMTQLCVKVIVSLLQSSVWPNVQNVQNVQNVPNILNVQNVPNVPNVPNVQNVQREQRRIKKIDNPKISLISSYHNNLFDFGKS